MKSWLSIPSSPRTGCIWEGVLSWSRCGTTSSWSTVWVFSLVERQILSILALGSGAGGALVVWRGLAHQCPWAGRLPLPVSPKVPPPAACGSGAQRNDASLQSRHAADRCGAAETCNLLSHSCLGQKKKKRYIECLLAANWSFLLHRLPVSEGLSVCRIALLGCCLPTWIPTPTPDLSPPSAFSSPRTT